MNRTRLIFIGLAALGLGLLASGWAYRSLEQRSGAQVKTREIMVAASDIPVGTRIEEKDVRKVQIPMDAIPPGAFGGTRRLLGRGAILPIAQGEFFISGKNLAPENAGSGLPSLIPAGMRAVSVRVSDSAVGGFIPPGSRVDVLMTGVSNSGEALTQTVLKNVEVLANGTRLDRNAAGVDAQNSPLMTLLVSPDDAEKLTLATAQGHIQLALRNPLDTGQNDIGALGIHSFYPSAKSPTPTVVARAKRPAPVVHVQPAAPSPYQVEVIKGDKRDVTNLSD